MASVWPIFFSCVHTTTLTPPLVVEEERKWGEKIDIEEVLGKCNKALNSCYFLIRNYFRRITLDYISIC